MAYFAGKSRASKVIHSRELVGAPALALVAHSLLNNVIVGVALLASLVTTLGLYEIMISEIGFNVMT